MKPFKGVETVRAASGHELEVVFRGDPRPYRVDVTADFSRHASFRPLLVDSAAFAEVKVIYDGDGIGWSPDLDMCGEHLWRLAHVQAGDLMATEEFRAWRARHELSLSAPPRPLACRGGW